MNPRDKLKDRHGTFNQNLFKVNDLKGLGYLLLVEIEVDKTYISLVKDKRTLVSTSFNIGVEKFNETSIDEFINLRECMHDIAQNDNTVNVIASSYILKNLNLNYINGFNHKELEVYYSEINYGNLGDIVDKIKSALIIVLSIMEWSNSYTVKFLSNDISKN